MKNIPRQKPIAEMVIACYFIPLFASLFFMSEGIHRFGLILAAIVAVSVGALILFFFWRKWEQEWHAQYKALATNAPQPAPFNETERQAHVARLQKELQEDLATARESSENYKRKLEELTALAHEAQEKCTHTAHKLAEAEAHLEQKNIEINNLKFDIRTLLKISNSTSPRERGLVE